MNSGREVLRNALWAAVFVAASSGIASCVFAQSARFEDTVRGPFAEAISVPATKTNSSSTIRKSHISAPGRLPMSFVENQGQGEGRVRFLSRTKGYVLALTGEEAVLRLHKKPSTVHSDTSAAARRANERTKVRMKFAGASLNATIAGLEQLPERIYFADANTKGPLTGNPTFRRVKYSGIYPGIDAAYYGNDQQLEFDFIVAPDADPKQIRLSFSGTEKIRLTETGEISLLLDGEEVRLKKPGVYQEHDGIRTEIAGGYLLSQGEARFELDAYDKNLPLIIDPTITFGSTADDSIIALEADAAGNSYVLGQTLGPATFPTTVAEAGIPSPFPCFLTKLDPQLTIIYSILFTDLTSCNALTLSPGGVPFFSSFMVGSRHASTIVSVNDLNGAPVITRFLAGNYEYSSDTTAPGLGVTAMAVNGAGNIFLLGPCRIVQTGDPALQLNGFNTQPDQADQYPDNACAPSNAPPFVDLRQMVLTVLDSQGQFLYGSLLSPGEHTRDTPSSDLFLRRYSLAADDAGRAFILGTTLVPLLTTADAFRFDCIAQPLCNYLMIADTSQTGPASLRYSTYLWKSGAQAQFVRLGANGAVYLASDGSFVQDPNISPAPPYAPFPLPASNNGIQLARFDSDPNGVPNDLRYAFVFSPAVDASASSLSTESLRGMRVLPSGSIALSTAVLDPANRSLAGEDVIEVFFPSGQARAPVIISPLYQTNNTPPDTAPIAADASGNLYLARATVGNSLQSDVTADLFPQADPGANTPPAIQLPADLTVPAATAVGAFVSYPLSFGDVEDGTNLRLQCDHYPGVLFPVGATSVTCSVTDSGNLTTSASFILTVTPAPPNTPVGTNVASLPADEGPVLFLAVYQPVALTFGAVAITGNTRLHSRYDVTPPPPDGQQAGSPPIYLDLETTATYDVGAGIDLCIDIRGMSLANPGAISIYQLQNGGWASLTSSVVPGVQICAHTSSLGTFAIFYPAVPETRITTIAGTGFARGELDGPGSDSRDDVNDGGPATASALSPVTGTIDRVRNVLYVSDLFAFSDPSGIGTRIRKIDLGTGLIDAVPGTESTSFPIYGMALNSSGDLYFSVGCEVRKKSFATGEVSLVAGNGVCGYAGDGLPAVQAQIDPFRGQLAFDRVDNLFIADQTNARIRRVDALTGIISTVAGDGTFRNPDSGSRPTLTGFGGATGMAIDNQGYLLIANSLQLMRISPGADGIVDGSSDEVLTVIAGCVTNCTSPYGGDGNPITDQHAFVGGDFLSVASDGAVLVTEQRGSRIRRIDPGSDGVVTGAADEIIWTVAGFFYPITNGTGIFNGDTFSTESTLALPGLGLEDAQGNLLIIDNNNHRVRLTGYSPSIVSRNSNMADLAVAATATPDPVDVASLLNYGPITVTNNGPANGTAVALNLPLPSSVNFDNVSTTQGSCSTPSVGSSGLVSCNLGSIASGASVVVNVTVRPQTGGPLSTTIGVSGAESDPHLANNNVTVSATVNLTPAVINVSETITVTDSVNVLPSAMIGVNENITVADGVNVLPSAMIGVNENVTVTDSVSIPVNQTPSVTAFAPPIVEATSPAGAAVTLAGSGNDPDSGDTLTFAWTEGATQLGTTANVPATLSIGVHNLTFTATDNHGASAAAAVTVTVQDTTAPSLFAPPSQTLEATGPSGAVATFTASATDLVDGAVRVRCAPASGSSFPLGTTTVICTAADDHSNTANATFTITVRDTTAPVVTPPSSITIPATEAGGARASAWPALAAFLPGATAEDLVDTAPLQLTPLVGNLPLGNNRLFPIGTTVVTFRFRDASNNIGTASASVTVIVGSPKISGQIAAEGRNADGTFFVDVSFTNTGTGNARRLRVFAVLAGTTQGGGTVRVISPAFPMTVGIGNLDVGATQTVHVVLRVPSTVRQFALVELGDFTNINGVPDVFVLRQNVSP